MAPAGDGFIYPLRNEICNEGDAIARLSGRQSDGPSEPPDGDGMSSMTVPERICHFLVQRSERRYCDTCIQERLGLKWRQQVQLITATLAVTAGFRREFHKCCTCNETKQVTSAVKSQPRSELGKLGAFPRRRETRLDAPPTSAAQSVEFVGPARPITAPNVSRRRE
jgi:hypothetical protein